MPEPGQSVAAEHPHTSISPSLLADHSLGKSWRAKDCLISPVRNYRLIKGAPLTHMLPWSEVSRFDTDDLGIFALHGAAPHPPIDSLGRGHAAALGKHHPVLKR